MRVSSTIDRSALAASRPDTKSGDWRAPLAFLLVSGSLLGVTTTLAKLAASTGLPPLPFLSWSLVLASALLIVHAAIRRTLPRLDRRTIEYVIVAALLSVVIPQWLFVSAVGHVGAGFVSLALALPPLLTYGAALALLMERFDTVRAIGVVLALTGAGVIAVPKLAVSGMIGLWALATLIGSAVLAAGNIYRTLRWPPDASPQALAPAMIAAAATILLVLGALSGELQGAPVGDAMGLMLIGAQGLVFALQYLFFFQLQKRAGPVYLSLLGSVGAVVGVPLAILALGEAPPQGLALAAGLIAAGVALVTRRASTVRPAASAGRRSERS